MLTRTTVIASFICLIGLLTVACSSDQATSPGPAAQPTATTVPTPTTGAPATVVAAPLAPPVPSPTATPEPEVEVEPVTIPPDAAVKLDEYITAYVDLGYFSGSVLVAQGDNVILSKGYGMADYDQGIPNTPQTKFGMGALTQQFTAMVILQLQEEGLLLVDDPIAKYLPDFPNGELMTIHHALIFASGLEDYTGLPEFEDVAESPTSVNELIALFEDEPLVTNPGQSFSGFNSGYVLLGAIIEQVSGMAYEEYLQQNIFEPLGMANSGYNLSDPTITDEALGYAFTGGEPAVEQPFDLSNGYSAFGLYSTTEDLYRWDRALLTEQLASRASINDMFTRYREFGLAGNVAYGWNIHAMHRHNAASWGFEPVAGYKQLISRLTDDDVVIIVMSNGSLSPVVKMTFDMAALLLDVRYTIPEEHEAIVLDSEKLDDYVGEYGFITVTREGDDLFMEFDDLPKFQISPETTTRFFTDAADIEIRFTKTDLAGVIGLILQLDGGAFFPQAEINVSKTLAGR